VTEPDKSNSFFARRGFVAAAAFVALVLVALIVVVLTGGGRPDPTPQVGVGGPATFTPPASDGGCDQPEGDQLPPVAAPNNEWELVGKLVAPTDPDGAGPGKVSDEGLRTCFAHDPTGALFAAVNWFGMTSDVESMTAALEEITAPGPGRDKLAGLLETDPTSVLGKGGYQVAGFTFLSYTGDVAMLNLALDIAGTGQASLTATLEWSGDDWLLQLPADGEIGSSIKPLSSLAGYVPWSGA
jgi:hypothetical protein